MVAQSLKLIQSLLPLWEGGGGAETQWVNTTSVLSETSFPHHAGGVSVVSDVCGGCGGWQGETGREFRRWPAGREEPSGPAQGSSMPFAYEVQVHLAWLLSQTRKVLSDLCPTCFSSHVFPNEHIAVWNFQITVTSSV